MAEGEQVLHGCLSRLLLVDADKVEVGSGWSIVGRWRVDDHGGEVAAADCVDQRIVADEGIEDQAVDGNLADCRSAAVGPLGVGGDDDQGQLVRVRRVGEALHEMDRGEILEGIGEPFPHHDTDGVGSTFAEVATGGIGPCIAECGCGAQHAFVQRR